ncbi:HEPN domain-containing protein [bacterium]|nr:HEPN domain-containing protein [bacterium]
MNAGFKECLSKNKIMEFSRGKALASKEIKIAEDDYKTAKVSFDQSGYKWATVQAYYSMFHSARALLYAKNYREKSHACLIIAIRALYVDEKLLPVRLIEYLQNAKMLRENADYSNEWSRDGAEILLNAAEDFLFKSKALINKTK